MWEKGEVADKVGEMRDTKQGEEKAAEMKGEWMVWKAWVKKCKLKFPFCKMPQASCKTLARLQTWIQGMEELLARAEIAEACQD